MTQLIGTWLLFAAWQATLLLAVSLFVGRLYRKTPWQSHDVSQFGLVTAVLAPSLSTVIASRDGGWFAAAHWSEPLAPLSAWSGVIGTLLVIGAALFLLSLAWGIVTSRRLMFRAKPFPDRESQEALLRGAETLQNVSLPILFTSQNVKSPTVWCWGLHPAVLLPEELAADLPAEERDAIFLHELAHITRRDHLTALLARLCGIFLFWNPLYWLVLRRADLLADEACDLLVLSRGKVSPETYTETLLRLAAGERYRPAFQFLSRKEKIMKRINTILDFGETPQKPSVRPSRLWQCSALVVALLLSVTLAFCQEKKNSDLSEFEIKSYKVDKNVADFPEKYDLSTPEAAYVTYARTMHRANPDLVGEFEKLSIPSIKLTEEDKKSFTLPPDDWCKICLSAQVLGVQISGDEAIVVAKFEGSDVRSPYDVRWFEKIDGKWLNAGNDRVDSVQAAAQKFRSALARKNQQKTDADAVSLQKYLKIDGLKRYEVNKRIADFPADKIDLSTPEAAYATQKNLIVSNRKDKVAQLENMTFGRPKISGRELKGMNDEVPEELANAYRNEFVIYEVYVQGNQAFVFGQRKDRLYDGNYFTKVDDQWLNRGNEQAELIEEFAKNLNKDFFDKRSDRPEGEKEQRVKTYEVNKNVSDFPGAVDLSTPEAAYALTNRTIASDNPDKINEIAQYTRMQTIPKNMIEWIESMTPETRESMKNAKILKVLVYKNRDAMVIAEIVPGERYNTRLLANENGRWFNAGGGGFVKGNRETCLKNFEAAFMKTVARWDSETETTVWKTPDNVGHTHMAIFEPAGDFDPKTPQELLDKLNETLFQRKDVVTGYFRTGQDKDMKLIGRICTNNPGGLKEVIESIPELKLVKIGTLTAEVFAMHSGIQTVLPQIVAMEPANGDDNVDAFKVKELRVTFDRDMDTSGYSWCGGGKEFPETAGEPKWLDKRTCVLPVKLAHGAQYRFWINSAENKNFKSEDGVPVLPAPFSFRTKFLNRSGHDRATPVVDTTPKIVELEPANGATDVDADTVKELRVTFDRDMDTSGYSWCGGGDSYPETTGEAKWLDKRTCVLPVKLKPGHQYVLGINARDFRNFKSADGIALIPAAYLFNTKRVVRSANDPEATIFDKLPQIPDIKAAEKPLPIPLVRSMVEKRKSVHSAEYTVTSYMGPDRIMKSSALFRFQGDKQWYVDISGMMSFGDWYREHKLITGCDGQTEWTYNKAIHKDEKRQGDNRDSCKQRTLESIREISTSFLDPLNCLDVTTDDIVKHCDDRGITYLGEASFEGKPLQLFGTTFESAFGNEKMQNDIVFAFDAETLLPRYTLHLSETKSFGKTAIVYFYDIGKVNHEFAAEDFRPELPEGVKPELLTKPDEGYDTFFVRVHDGADGRVSVRVGGQRGDKGTMSSGLN